MNAGYEYDVRTTPDGKIVREVTEVEPLNIRRQIIFQIIDVMEAQTRQALVKLGWTPPLPERRVHRFAPARCYSSSPDPRIRILERRIPSTSNVNQLIPKEHQ